MKTSPAARRLVRFRVILIALAIVAIMGIEFWEGESLASRVGQTTAVQTDSPVALNVNISDMIAVAR
jgi:hypothetical protein